ncbi:MAG: hypothetical protein ACR2NM_14715 [Bythopirellula sp.]
MRRLMTFGMGMVFGGLVLWAALHYHVLNTKSGLRMVPKVNASLSKTYVDIRGFTVVDWARNTDLVLALTNANQADLVENAVGDAVENGIDRWLNLEGQR